MCQTVKHMREAVAEFETRLHMLSAMLLRLLKELVESSRHTSPPEQLNQFTGLIEEAKEAVKVFHGRSWLGKVMRGSGDKSTLEGLDGKLTSCLSDMKASLA